MLRLLFPLYLRAVLRIVYEFFTAARPIAAVPMAQQHPLRVWVVSKMSSPPTVLHCTHCAAVIDAFHLYCGLVHVTEGSLAGSAHLQCIDRAQLPLKDGVVDCSSISGFSRLTRRDQLLVCDALDAVAARGQPVTPAALPAEQSEEEEEKPMVEAPAHQGPTAAVRVELEALLAGGGYPPEWFLSAVDDDFVCGICTCVCRDVVGSACCGRLLCLRCVERWLSEPRRGCPSCNAAVDSAAAFTSNAYVERKVRSLPTRCPLACDQCAGLVIGVNERAIKEHLAQHCPNRAVSCPLGCGGSVIACELDAHQRSCPCYSVAEAFVEEASARLRQEMPTTTVEGIAQRIAMEWKGSRHSQRQRYHQLALVHRTEPPTHHTPR